MNQIVGWYRTGGLGSFVHGFVWQNGAYAFDSPFGTTGNRSLNAINDSGVIASDDYVYLGGRWLYLGDTPTGFQIQLQDINNVGIMVGHNGFQGIIVAPAGYSRTTYDPQTGALTGIVNSVYPIPESSSGLRSMAAMPLAFTLSSYRGFHCARALNDVRHWHWDASYRSNGGVKNSVEILQGCKQVREKVGQLATPLVYLNLFWAASGIALK